MNEPFEYVEMQIPAKPEYAGVIRLALSGIASNARFAYEEIEDLKIAVSEACANVIQHACKNNQREIAIRFGLSKSRMEMIVSESRRGFELHSARNEMGLCEQTDFTEILREGGLGYYLIKSLMDEVSIHHKEGITVLMTKYLEGEQVERNAETIST